MRRESGPYSKAAGQRAETARADSVRLEGELRGESGVITATRDSYDQRLEGLVRINADFEVRAFRMSESRVSDTGPRDCDIES
jgi:hypothetical protein